MNEAQPMTDYRSHITHHTSRITHHSSLITHHPIVCIIGLGYVGLPLAQAFSKSVKVIGFDTDAQKVNQLVSQQSGSLQSTVTPPTPGLMTLD